MRALRPAWLVLVAIVAIAASARASGKRCLPSEEGPCEAPANQLASLQLAFQAPAAEAPARPRAIAPERPRALERELRGHHRRLRDIARRLLLQEISQTERLFEATPGDSPDHPRLQRRLAEAYVELAQGLERDQRALVRRRDAAGARALESRVKRARRRGIGYYRDLVDQHPGYCITPRHPIAAERGCLDEILFFLAYELEQDGDALAARAVYQRLVESQLGSKYRPAAHLAFAELLFERARSDAAAWPEAAAAYEKVLATPDNPYAGYARYKLGHVHWSTGDHARALDAFKKVVDHGERHPSHPHAAALLAAARRDIVPVFAQAGQPGRAHAFFASLGGSPRDTRAMLEDLGVALMDSGHFDAAIELFRDLVGRFGDARACRYRASLAQAVMATRAGDKAAITRALDDLVAHHRALAGDDDERLVCANLTAALVTETAMAWHVEAAGTGGRPGSGDAATLDAAEHLYRLAEASFDAQQWSTFRFPRIARHDWPTLARVHRAHALLLAHRLDFSGCGEAFSRAAEVDPGGPEAPEALHLSALCWQQAYLAQRSPHPSR